MKAITKTNKNTGEKTLVSVKEFLDFVGTGAKKREAALTEIIEGGLYQNIEISFILEPMRNPKSSK